MLYGGAGVALTTLLQFLSFNRYTRFSGIIIMLHLNSSLRTIFTYGFEYFVSKGRSNKPGFQPSPLPVSGRMSPHAGSPPCRMSPRKSCPRAQCPPGHFTQVETVPPQCRMSYKKSICKFQAVCSHFSVYTYTRNKNIKNVKKCRDGMPKSMQTR